MQRFARWSTLAASIAVVAQYAVIVGETLGYPFQLEWMEGGMLEVAARVRAGEPLYLAPSVDYTPYVYPPLYFVAVAGVSFVAGLDLFAGRLVSIAAIAVVCAVAWRIVRRETGSHTLGVAAVGLFIATYELTGRWFHLARVDALYLALTLGAVYVLRFRPTLRGAAIGGALLCLAYFTKQTALLMALPVFVAVAFVDARRAAAAAGTFTGASLVATVIASALTDGWFLYYTVDLPLQHELAVGEASGYLAGTLPPLLPVLGVALATLGVVWRRDRPTAIFYIGVLSGSLLSSWLAFARSGSYLNALMPGCAAVAIVAPLGAAALRNEAAARAPGCPVRQRPRARLHEGVARFGAPAAALGLLGQLALLTHPVRESLPTGDAVAAGEHLQSWLASRKGEVLLPDHRFVQTRAGKEPHGLGMAARDVLRADPGDHGRRILRQSLADALSRRRFSTIVLSQRNWLGGVVARFYEPAGELDRAPTPVTGWRIRPTWVWERPETNASSSAGGDGNG